MKARVNSITRLRVNSDGTGVRDVVFFYGCPLNCVWCCNPETRFGDSFEIITEDELFQLISRDLIYFQNSNGGITFSGGEPLSYSEYIFAFLKKYGNLFNTNLETSLCADYSCIQRIAPYINEWYIDLKKYDETSHSELTGKSNIEILNNIKKLSQEISTEKMIITYPVITNINDSAEDIDNIIQFMSSCSLHKVKIHPYRKITEKKYQAMGMSHNPIPELPDSTVVGIFNRFVESGLQVIVHDTKYEKQKCEYLKRIRRIVCEQNGFPIVIPECNYNGRCAGTCPQCEYELEVINSLLLEEN